MNTWDSLSYLAQSIGWGILGFLGGYLAGRTARDVHHIATAIPEGSSTVDKETPARTRRRWRPTGQFLLGVVVVLLGILTVAQGLVSDAETRRLTQCQSTYANASADALDARSKANVAAQDALDALITQIAATSSGGGEPTPAQREKARAVIADYIAKRAEQKTLLQQHPLPPAPRSCE